MTTPTELRDKATKATQETIQSLRHIRGCSEMQAARSVAASFAENLADSRGTTMEGYWQAMVSASEKEVTDLLSSSDSREPRYTP